MKIAPLVVAVAAVALSATACIEPGTGGTSSRTIVTTSAPKPPESGQLSERTKGVTWVVESIGHSGGRISPTNKGRDFASCVNKKNLTSDDYDGPRDWPWIEVDVTRAVAENLNKGDACPLGKVSKP